MPPSAKVGRWLRRHLKLPDGIPVAVTFNRVFAAIDPDEFRQIFIDVIARLELSGGRVVALDGRLSLEQG
ncbi:MAG: transposase family protein [Endozoicomonadaceae bacterium]|nr:transposase family protein [Endozoicomonadaceae bacterium]